MDTPIFHSPAFMCGRASVWEVCWAKALGVSTPRVGLEGMGCVLVVVVVDESCGAEEVTEASAS